MARRSTDRLLLILAALSVCIVEVTVFWAAGHYGINPVWVFLLGNSFVLIALFVRDFRSHLRKPAFVAFLTGWALVHGILVATLMRWLSIPAIVPFMAVELFAGLILADFLFQIRPLRERK